MASKGNFGARNRSNRGRNSSHFQGQRVHQSCGDLSHGGGSNVKDRKPQHVSHGGRGESHPWRGRGESLPWRGRDESLPWRGRGEGHPWRGRGESLPRRGRGEGHPWRGTPRRQYNQNTYSYVQDEHYLHDKGPDFGRNISTIQHKGGNETPRKPYLLHYSSRGTSAKNFALSPPNIQPKNSATRHSGSTHSGGHIAHSSGPRNVFLKNTNQKYREMNFGAEPFKFDRLQSTTSMNSGRNLSSSNSAPHILFKRKLKNPSDRKKSKSVDSSSKESVPKVNESNPNVKQKRSNKRTNQKWWNSRKAFKVDRVQPSSGPSLLNFSRAPAKEDSSALYEEDSDVSDTVSTVSHCSSVGSDPSTLQDEFLILESDSSSEECESISGLVDDVKSECQNSGTVKHTDPSLEVSNSGPKPNIANFGNAESFIAVYWDIENCPVPPQKSAIDIVKKVRDTFYTNRTESDFIVACDIRNLNKVVIQELSEALVNVIHTDSRNKNAADQKLQSFLTRFQHQFEKTGSAVVLISGDSDFSCFLNEMRYRHHIYIDLICLKSARKALRVAAHECVYYEDFLKDLPDRKTDNIEFCMVVTNLPKKMSDKAIKNELKNILKSVDSKTVKICDREAEIMFLDKNGLEKAKSLLEGAIVCGSILSLTCYTKCLQSSKSGSSKKCDFEDVSSLERSDVQTCNSDYSADGKTTTAEHKDASGKQKQMKKKKMKENKNSELVISGENNSFETAQCKEDTEVISKNATLKINVQYRVDDEHFWRNELLGLLKTPDFTIQKDESDCECLYVNFSSIGKAQKAQKKIQKVQQTNPLAPKFIKLIKNDITLNCKSESKPKERKTNIVSEKTEEIKKLTENKRKHYLQKFEEKLTDINKQCEGISHDALEVIKHKMKELKEQKDVFLRYNSNYLKKLSNLSQIQSNIEEVCNDYCRDFSRECASFMEGLPIYAKKDDILNSVKKNQVVLIRAETGSGKSTQIIQYLWRNGFAQKGVIVCTQPRKLAAISVAKHVSIQIGSALGGIVGYQVGLASKKSDETQILFMTDFTMLKLCVNNLHFEGISCIIIDEAHERSIYTDLLLGMIKNSLPMRSDLHVIVTSATIDTSVFCKYFNLQEKAVLQISGRTFPVEDVWLEKDVNVGWKYLEEVVNTTMNLLKEPPGDILAFLTTPLETEQASALLKEKLSSNKKVIIHHLHGKLDISEQQKVFLAVSRGSRKVVFATNCAETSITIPNIRYVIDSGMVKESKYDAVRNLNVLSVGFVSRSSAEQRRGRAGRTQAGKCVRLYSKSNYQNDMASNTDPEILRVNLGQALLKLMELGVQNPRNFDFVESPRDSLSVSMKQLFHLGAVDQSNGMLSDMGKKMAKIPLEPRLSYIIFKGIEQNIGYESVVIAALATVSRNIFFRNRDNEKEADAKKVRFCQSESDFLTYFEIFKEWIGTPKAERSQWCVLNCINAKSMQIALDLITELLKTLRQELHIQLNSGFTEKPSFVEEMHDIMFYSFLENLCVFSGYNKLGYCSPGMQGEFQVHPSSSLCYLGQWKPQYIVYDTILKTSQSFLLNITPVSKEAVENAIHCEWLPYSLDELKSLTLCPYHIVPIGEVILKMHICGKGGKKRVALEKQLQDRIRDNSCGIEVKFAKGEVIVHLAENFHHYVDELIFPIIMNAQQQLYDEQEVLTTPDLPKLDIVLGAGAEIKEIVLPWEYRTVHVKTSPDILSSVVAEKLSEFGDIYQIKEYPRHAAVTFFHVSSALNAVKNHKNTTFSVRPLLRKNHEMYRGERFFKVAITITRRPCTGLAFVSFKSHDFPEAANSLCGKSIYYGFSNLIINVNRTNPEELFIKGLPPCTTKENLKNLLTERLPKSVEINQIKVIRIKEFPSCDADVDEMKQNLIAMFSDYTNTDKVNIECKRVKPKDFTWNAWAYFHNSQDGQVAVTALKGRSITVKGQQQSLELKPLLRNTVFCNSEIFIAVKDQIEEALNFYKKGATESDQLNISAKNTETNSGVVITIASNNLSDITDARNCIMNILMGDKILCLGKPRLEKLFLQQGKLFLKNLEDKIQNICIKLNHRMKEITIFGSDSTCSHAKTKINKYLDSLSEEESVNICLISNDYPRGLLRELVKRHGYKLDSLTTLCNLQSIEIETSRHILTVTGDTHAIEKVKEVLKEISRTLDDNIVTDENDETCAICLMPVDEKFHRLEYCGHAYCQTCILFQFRTQDIPFECPREDCKMPVVIEDIKWVLKKDNEVKSQLSRKALEHFVERNKDNIHYCPVPDCPMVYRADQGDDHKFSCPACQNDICTKCRAVFHHGMSCEMYKCSKNDEDYSLKAFLREDPNNRKQCPKCSLPIEKNGGCNHMTCWKCNCHMCWLCERVFSTGEEVYLHQPSCSRKPSVLRQFR